MIRRPPRSTLDRSSAASDVYKRQLLRLRLPRKLRGRHLVPTLRRAVHDPPVARHYRAGGRSAKLQGPSVQGWDMPADRTALVVAGSGVRRVPSVCLIKRAPSTLIDRTNGMLSLDVASKTASPSTRDCWRWGENNYPNRSEKSKTSSRDRRRPPLIVTGLLHNGIHVR